MTESAVSPYKTRVLEANGEAISPPSIQGAFGRYLFPSTAGVLRADLAAPSQSLDKWKCKVVNSQSDPRFLFSEDGFALGRELIPIPPGKEVDFECGAKYDASGYAWDAKADWMPEVLWDAYTPTKVWTTHDATGITELFTYRAAKGLLSLDFQIEATDGKDAAGLTFTPPFTLPDINAMVPFECWVQIGSATPVRKIGYVNMDDTTAANRLMTIVTGTLTDASTAKIWGSLWCPYDENWTTWTPAIGYTGGTPANLTTKYIYKEIDGLIYGLIANYSSDPDNATSQATYTLPFPTIDNYSIAKYPAIGMSNVNGTYADNRAYIVADQAAAASRTLTFEAFTLYVDNQVGAHYAAFCYPIPGQEVTYDLSATGIMTWASAALTPGTMTRKSYWRLLENDRMFWVGSMTGADGNGANSLTIKPPAPPRKRARRIRVIAYKLVNATWAACGGWLDCNQDNPDDRLLKFDDFGTMTDAQACGLRFVVIYEI